MAKVILKKGRDYTVRHGHPWIFSGAVESVSGSPSAGSTVAVASVEGETLGWGSFSPTSQIRVRMLSFDPAAEPGEKFVRSLVSAAIGRRAAMLQGGYTDACRLIHGESDDLPGVTADFYAGWGVVQLASAGAEHWKETIVSALQESLPGLKGVFNRSDVDARAREGLSTSRSETVGVLAGDEPPERIEIHEGGVRYLVDIRSGHKTGFYLDQREARASVARLAGGRKVLNCFSYTGGFGLACTKAGAAEVENVDLSGAALEIARANFALNGAEDRTAFVEADVFKRLRLYRDQGRAFDMIVLDPPKFAESKSHLMRAARGYKDINLLAMKLLAPGGVLATFSCSGAVTPDMFGKICAEAAFDAHRELKIVGRTFQAEDHPVSLSFPEGLYLKGLILRA